MKDVVIKNIHAHLISCGFSAANSATQAGKAWQFFQKQICNSRDPYKDACDYAGGAGAVNRAQSEIQITKDKNESAREETSRSVSVW